MKSNSSSPIDDIPQAQRDEQVNPKSSKPWRGWRRWGMWFLVGLLSAVAGLVVSWLTYSGNVSQKIIAEPVVPTETEPPPAGTSLLSTDTASGTAPDNSVENAPQLPPDDKSLLGHRAYEEVPESDLVALAGNSAIKLQPTAAAAFDTMAEMAAAQGIYLVPLSGFRSFADQEYLFFDVKAQRGQVTTTRAEVSAPPGYSEHHTGYAIDIGDANFPDTNLQINFEETKAFQWLEANAPRYSFELSFPEGNAQNIQYEPWHWRYVGDTDSLETFYQDR